MAHKLWWFQPLLLQTQSPLILRVVEGWTRLDPAVSFRTWRMLKSKSVLRTIPSRKSRRPTRPQSSKESLALQPRKTPVASLPWTRKRMPTRQLPKMQQLLLEILKKNKMIVTLWMILSSRTKRSKRKEKENKSRDGTTMRMSWREPRDHVHSQMMMVRKTMIKRKEMRYPLRLMLLKLSLLSAIRDAEIGTMILTHRHPHKCLKRSRLLYWRD